MMFATKKKKKAIRAHTECMRSADSMLHILEWLCAQLMEAEINSRVGVLKASAKQPTKQSATRLSSQALGYTYGKNLSDGSEST